MTNATNRSSVKEMLETTLVLFQILAIIVAGVWAYSRWGIKDASELMPRFNEVIDSITSDSFVSGDDGSCTFTTAWFLNNKGKTPLKVSDIELEIYSLPDISSNPYQSTLIDLGVSERLLPQNLIHSKTLSPGSDDLSAEGTISRSISFAYFPESGREWFKSNQIVLSISANVRQFSGGKTLKSEIVSSEYICNK